MQRLTCAGLDVGSSSIKVAVVDDDGDGATVRTLYLERIRRRDPRVVLAGALAAALGRARVDEADLGYIA